MRRRLAGKEGEELMRLIFQLGIPILAVGLVGWMLAARRDDYARTLYRMAPYLTDMYGRSRQETFDGEWPYTIPPRSPNKQKVR